MAQHIQGKDGKFAGSIGDGKNNVPISPDSLLKAGALIEADNQAYTAGLDDLSDGLSQVSEMWNNFEAQLRQQAEARAEMNERHRHAYDALVVQQDQRYRELLARQENEYTELLQAKQKTTEQSAPQADSSPVWKRFKYIFLGR